MTGTERVDHSGNKGPSHAWWAQGPAITLALVLALVLGGCDLVSTIPASTTSTTGSVTIIPIKVIKGPGSATLAQVPVYIGKQGPFPFIVDTGASETLIARALATRLHLPRDGSSQSVSGVGGKTVVIPVAIASWRVGDAALPKATVASGSLPDDQGADGIQGLLGSDIWSAFGKITIDFNADTLTVYAKLAARSGPALAATLGPSPEAVWAFWRRPA